MANLELAQQIQQAPRFPSDLPNLGDNQLATTEVPLSTAHCGNQHFPSDYASCRTFSTASSPLSRVSISIFLQKLVVTLPVAIPIDLLVQAKLWSLSPVPDPPVLALRPPWSASLEPDILTDSSRYQEQQQHNGRRESIRLTG